MTLPLIKVIQSVYTIIETSLTLHEVLYYIKNGQVI